MNQEDIQGSNIQANQQGPKGVYSLNLKALSHQNVVTSPLQEKVREEATSA